MIDFDFQKKRWQTLKDKKVFETPIFNLHKKQCQPEEDKAPGDFFILDAPEWVNVLALTEDNRFILVEQYRHGIDRVTLEIPGGMADPNEKPAGAAKRELEEETGYSSKNWQPLGKVSSNPAILTNYTHLYLATGCRKTASQQSDGFEDIKIHTVEEDLFYQLVEEGVIHHSIVVAAVAKYLLKFR